MLRFFAKAFKKFNLNVFTNFLGFRRTRRQLRSEEPGSGNQIPGIQHRLRRIVSKTIATQFAAVRITIHQREFESPAQAGQRDVAVTLDRPGRGRHSSFQK